MNKLISLQFEISKFVLFFLDNNEYFLTNTLIDLYESVDERKNNFVYDIN